ncbi:Hypothetical protein Minf_2458 [Methylacidiphilum infernorum V4]|uniref:Uncharacterized protein n=1 Tax=Methylacidiphilum infernorum (isolate V4) TaxID=481448 RepID=B3E135_METI4|nr:Hypothetical protein Minf_2458 [Methylacidiphilum infernorum V4]
MRGLAPSCLSIKKNKLISRRDLPASVHERRIGGEKGIFFLGQFFLSQDKRRRTVG